MNKALTHLLLVASIVSPVFVTEVRAAAIKADVYGGPAAVVAVDADCFALGEDKAAEMGGTLAKAKPDMDGDTPVCRLVIVVPGKDGERPKRVEVTIPQ